MAPSLPTAGLDRRTLEIAGVVVIGLIMSVIDTTIVNVALERLAADLGEPLATIQWVSTGYLLALAVVIPLSGWATERFGSKRVWLVAIAVFGAGSALCGLSGSVEQLIAFRAVQGLGGGLLLPVGFTLATQAAGPQRAGRVLSLIGVPVLLGPILGPVLGGLIVDEVSWHWIFFVNLPIAVIAFSLAWRRLDGAAGRQDAGRLDWLGVAFACPGLVAVVFGLSQSERHGGFGDPLALGPILGGAALLAAFAGHALRADRPLVDLRLFRAPAFAAAAGATFLLALSLFGAILLLPLYFQVDRGESALHAGLLMAPQGLGTAIALPVSGRITDRLGGGPVVVAGTVLATLATLPWAFVAAGTPYPLLMALLFVRGLGMGASMQPALAAALAVLRTDQVPRATAALNTLRQVGASIGTAAAAVLLVGQTQAVLPPARGEAGGLAPLPPALRAEVAEPLAGAFGHVFAWAAAATALAIVGGLVLWWAETRTRRRVAGASAQEPRVAEG
ncbi:MAG: DHA2 family efflux MFS transporter permease subunit [Solirubrobacteraceae bacterium]|nr:DHA2 family efflux MFS transporter permease subunit [Solirubrobacteraceae bacterium]